MKRTNRCVLLLGLLCLFLLSLIPVPQALGQSGPNPLSFPLGVPFQLGQAYTFTSASTQTGPLVTGGLNYFEIVFVPTGTVSACTITLDGSSGGSFTTGSLIASQNCATAGSYITSSAVYSTQAKLTPTVTGTGSVNVYLYGFVTNPAVTGGSAASITSPVDGSGYVEMNCKVGCTGGNPNGQAVMASSAPVVIASNQSAIPVSGTFWQTTQPVSGTFWQATQPVSGTFWQATQPVSQATAANLNATVVGSGNFNTQPAGFGSIVAFQQAVTASAVVLATNSVHGFCVKALATNTITVYVGPSGVTTSTGYPLAPGDSVCYQGSNTNVAYVIASTTGASVGVSGN